eukprot:753835-Hanusia_phi.AAC.1
MWKTNNWPTTVIHVGAFLAIYVVVLDLVLNKYSSFYRVPWARLRTTRLLSLWQQPRLQPDSVNNELYTTPISITGTTFPVALLRSTVEPDVRSLPPPCNAAQQ